MAHLAQIARRHPWGASLTSLMALLGGLILADVLAPASAIQSCLVITGIITIPVILRVVRGSTAEAEAKMLKRVRKQRGKRSCFLDRQLTRSLKEKNPFIEVGEEVIVELHRTPFALISPRMIISVLAAVVMGTLVVIRLAISSIFTRVTAVIGLVILAVLSWHFPYWVLGGFAITVVLVVSTVIRYWRVQTVVVTDRNFIRFDGLHAKPTKLPRSGPYELMLSRPMSAHVATWLRVAKVPWDNILVLQVYSSTTKSGQSIKTTKFVGEIKSLTGAQLVLEGVVFAIKTDRQPELKKGT
jgi:hypothetical protein